MKIEFYDKDTDKIVQCHDEYVIDGEQSIYCTEWTGNGYGYKEAKNVGWRVVDQWQPIETAPKNLPIWAYNGEQQVMKWSEGKEWALWIWNDPVMCDIDPCPDQPTHWMPLPPPPESAK